MTPLVLLPGMMCDARLFAPQIAAFSGRRAVHVSPITCCDTVEKIAEEVLETAPPSFALAGLSMGGIVAMEVIRQAPDRVERLALLDTNPKAEAQAIKDRRLPQIERVLQGNLAAVVRDEMKPNYLSEGPNRKAILDTCMEMALALGADVFVRQSHALMNRPNQSATLRAVRVPTLILCGREDALCPVFRHEYMVGLIPGSVLQIIENAGHLPTLERPVETTEALAAWLDA